MEFMIKHPIITFLIVNEICTTIKTIAIRKNCNSFVDDACDQVLDVLETEKGDKKKHETKATIGFKID